MSKNTAHLHKQTQTEQKKYSLFMEIVTSVFIIINTKLTKNILFNKINSAKQKHVLF